MRLSAPKQITWIVALILGILGILGIFAVVPALAAYGSWLLVIAWAILILATMLDGL